MSQRSRPLTEMNTPSAVNWSVAGDGPLPGPSERSDDDAYPWGVLLLAASGLPLPLARLLAPASAPTGVTRALVAALGSGRHATLATLQLKAEGVFVSIRARDLIDITTTLDVLPAQLARLDTRREERRLVYAEGAWRIDP